MANNNDIYIVKAQEAIEYVYQSEYHNSLGIPMPIIQLLLADDPKYSTGEYYITINSTWQIHLNFGKLPISYKEFQDEVKVLTRHEIGHYMCCPYDAITQFRMLKCILNVYQKEFSNLGISHIDNLCRDLANQFADIIVDTRNYYLNPNETIKSEINWIKKCGGIQSSPRCCKLMFLAKEILWGQDLEIGETDGNLIAHVKDLSEKLLERGIDNRSLFLPKLEQYTRLYFELFIKDKKDHIQQGNQQSGQQQGSQQSGQQQGSQQSGQQQGGQQSGQQQGGQQSGQQQGSQQSDQQQGSQQNGQQQSNNKPTPKDGDNNGNSIVFADPNKVKDAIEQLASETSVGEFLQLLNIAGIHQLSEKEKEMLWFSVQSSDIIAIQEFSNKGSKDNYTYPTTWKIGDPTSDIDIMLTLSIAPKIIPGITTKKWEMSTNAFQGAEKKQKDLLLVVDTSGSMGNPMNPSSNMCQAIIASYCMINYIESVEGKVALIEFSDTVGKKVNWTKNYDEIRECLLINGHGGTSFPLYHITNIIEDSPNELVSVLITDGDLSNIQESFNFFRNYLNGDNKLYLFILGNSRFSDSYNKLKDLGAKVYHGVTADDFCNEVLSDL